MLKHFIVVAFALLLAAPAAAQGTEAPTEAPLPVESMNCEQMTAELMVAGQRMNAQMDPAFAAEAQAMQEEAQGGRARAGAGMVAGVGMGLACSIPGMGMACMAGQQAMVANAQAQTAQNQRRMNAQMDRLNASMEGLDQERLMAVSDRYQAMSCQAPAQ